MKPDRIIFNIIPLCLIILSVLTSQFCMKKQTVEKTTLPVMTEQNGLSESYRKTGWIDESKYRAVVYIITREECQNNTVSDIEERIRLEAFKQLQKEFNPAFSRNATVQIKNLIDKHGRVIAAGQSCIDSNVYFFDLEKRDLKTDFINIKNLK